MSILLLLILLLLIFGIGGGGLYVGPPYAWPGGLIAVVLLIALIFLFFR